MLCILFFLCLMSCITSSDKDDGVCIQIPPPLEVPLELIEKDPNAKEVNWDDDGVLASPMDFF